MTWENLLKEEQSKPYYKELLHFVNQEYKKTTCYPQWNNIFNAFRLTKPEDVKVVILGQDPYHEPNQAMGLAFSVQDDVPIPPSLKNIYSEIENEFNIKCPNNGNLTRWAEQGVLLLNSILTVRAHQAASHKGHGWETFTDAVLKITNNFEQPIVYILWGSYARSKKVFLNNPNHLILEAPHPSPLSVYRGFFGCDHFKKCNEFLTSKNVEPIRW